MADKIHKHPPTAAEFRAWLEKAIPVSGVTATALSRKVGNGRNPNLVRNFLATPGRGITADNMAAIYRELQAAAQAAGATLPALEGAP
jgi:hypothetical protein